MPIVFGTVRRVDVREWIKPTTISRARRSFLAAALVAAAATLFSAGCGFVKNTQDAEKVVARHFQMLATNGVDLALADYSDDFLKKAGKEEWRRKLTRASEKLGSFENYGTLNWKVFSNFNNGGSATTVELICQVNYSKHAARETFKLLKSGDEPNFKIVDHQIQSAALQPE